MSSMPPHAAKSIPLKFQVGDKTILSVSRRMVVKNNPLETLLSNDEYPLPTIGKDVDGIIFRSISIKNLKEIQKNSDRFLVYVRQEYNRYYASLEGNFESYMSGFSSKTRSTIKKKIRKFEELSGGKTDFREYKNPDEIQEFHRLARSVSKKTYQEQLLDSGLPDDAKYREKMISDAFAGNARGYLLFLNGIPVSYLYTPIKNRSVIYAYLGYDPDLSIHSPGTVLQLAAMEKLFSEQCHLYFDFTEGEGQHKRIFSTNHIECADVLFLNPTITNRIIIFFHRNFNTTISKIGNFAEQHGLKSKLKRWIRNFRNEPDQNAS